MAKKQVERPDTKGLVILDIILGVLTLFAVLVVGAAVIASVFYPKDFRDKVMDRAMEVKTDKMVYMMEKLDKNMMETNKKSDGVELLFVQEAESGTFTQEGDVYKLSLSGVDAQTLYFADRPNRLAGYVMTQDLLNEWNEGTDSFQSDPPNAAISVEGQEAASVVELANPVYDAEAGTLTYDATIIPEKSAAFSQMTVDAGSELPATFGATRLFIDSSAGAHLCIAGICISGGGSVNP